MSIPGPSLIVHFVGVLVADKDLLAFRQAAGDFHLGIIGQADLDGHGPEALGAVPGGVGLQNGVGGGLLGLDPYDDELKNMVDRILTAEMFQKSKPDPDCFLLGAKVFETLPANCVVFEDSFHGIQAGNAAGMPVVGLSTTNPAEAIQNQCARVIPNFTRFTYEEMMNLL